MTPSSVLPESSEAKESKEGLIDFALYSVPFIINLPLSVNAIRPPYTVINDLPVMDL